MIPKLNLEEAQKKLIDTIDWLRKNSYTVYEIGLTKKSIDILFPNYQSADNLIFNSIPVKLSYGFNSMISHIKIDNFTTNSILLLNEDLKVLNYPILGGAG